MEILIRTRKEDIQSEELIWDPLPAIKLLLIHGANPNRPPAMLCPLTEFNSDNKKPLFTVFCTKYLDVEIAKMIINQGLEARNISKLALFYLMEKLAEPEIVELIQLLARKGYPFTEDVTDTWDALRHDGTCWYPNDHDDFTCVTKRVAKYEEDLFDAFQRQMAVHPKRFPNPSNITHLGRAVHFGQMEVLKCLLDKNIGAVNPNHIEISECLFMATEENRLDMLTYLKQFYDSANYNKTGPPLDYHKLAQRACLGGHLDTLKFWMHNGLDLSQYQELEESSQGLLSISARYAHSNHVQFLITQGCTMSVMALSALPYHCLDRMKYIIGENNIAMYRGSRSVLSYMYPEILVLLAMYGIHISIDEGKTPFGRMEYWWEQARNRQQKIREDEGLFVKCLTAVRKALGGNVSQKSKCLPLPKLVMEQLTRPELLEVKLENLIKY